jgi:hypothetical protein
VQNPTAQCYATAARRKWPAFIRDPPDFTNADALIACNGDLAEIRQKRFAHKRAFLSDGVMIELLLVQPADGKLVTLFWGTTSHVWPADVLDQRVGGIRVASAASVLGYRTAHDRLTGR